MQVIELKTLSYYNKWENHSLNEEGYREQFLQAIEIGTPGNFLTLTYWCPE